MENLEVQTGVENVGQMPNLDKDTAPVKARKKPQDYGVTKETFISTWNDEANKTLADVCKALNMPKNVVNVRACNYKKVEGVHLKKLERVHKAKEESVVAQDQVVS